MSQELALWKAFYSLLDNKSESLLNANDYRAAFQTWLINKYSKEFNSYAFSKDIYLQLVFMFQERVAWDSVNKQIVRLPDIKAHNSNTKTRTIYLWIIQVVIGKTTLSDSNSLVELRGNKVIEEICRIAEMIASGEKTPTEKNKTFGWLQAKLIDFRIGPSTFIGGARDTRVGSPRAENGCDDLNRRPQMQDVFLVPPLLRSFDPDYPYVTLDVFAKALADDELEHGVHLLAGVRGSGKSTVINRIEWFANHWVKSRQRPFMLRFDLGSGYEHTQFIPSLMKTLCREVQAHTRRPPLGSCFEDWRYPRLRNYFDLTGMVGRWCSANIRWALIVGFVGIAALATQWVAQIPRQSSNEWDKAVGKLAKLGTDLSRKPEVLFHPTLEDKKDGNYAQRLKEIAANMRNSAPAVLPPLGEILRTNGVFIPLVTAEFVSRAVVANFNAITNKPDPKINLYFPSNAFNFLHSNIIEVDLFHRTAQSFSDLGDAFSLFQTNQIPLTFTETNVAIRQIITNIGNLGDNLQTFGNGLIRSHLASTIRNSDYLMDTRLTRFEMDEDDQILRLRPRSEPLSAPRDAGPLAWPTVLGFIALGILFVGFRHRRYQRTCSSPPGEYRDPIWPFWSIFFRLRHYIVRKKKGKPTPIWDIPFIIFWIAIIIFSAFSFSTVFKEGNEFASFPHPVPRAIIFLYVYSFLILFLATLQSYLPSWWHLKADCQTIEAELRKLDEDAKGEVTFFDAIAPLARMLLPAANDGPDLRELESSFLEQELKHLLHRIKCEFGHVIILIDDFDALPEDERENFFRALRPISKISGVICVVAVQLNEFLKYQKMSSPGDLHSTIHGIYVLGDPRLFVDCEWKRIHPDLQLLDFKFLISPGAINPPPGGAEAIVGFISDLLTANLRIWADDINSTPPFIVNFARRWQHGMTLSIWDKIESAFYYYGMSKREFLRECEKMFTDPDRKPFQDI